MSSSPADLRDAIVAQPPTPLSLARLSSQQCPAESVYSCLPAPPAPLCFPFTAQRLQGFDHLRLINYDAQLSSGSAKSKERKVPFSLPPGDPFCPRASSFLGEQLCPISLCIPLVQSPLCAGAGLQPARAASTCLSLTGSGITGFSKTSHIPR